MTENKPIYVDGINVSECIHYKNNGKCRIPHYQQSIKYTCCNCNEWDCYFKQLTRKTQECEDLKEQLENFCFDCDVAERMRKVVYAVTGGRLSYANYTVEAIEQAYNDQLLIDVENRTKELEEQLKQAEQKLEKIRQVAESCMKGDVAKIRMEQILQIIDEVQNG